MPSPADRPIRIGNCSGFYGDRLAAMHEMLTGGPLDVLTGDYLAELTMLILFRAKAKDPTKGYATTFLRQLEECLGVAAEQGVRIVVNAGGLNPGGCAQAVADLASRLGLTVRVSHVLGDDVLGAPGIAAGTVSANAYLGAFPIAVALGAGADVVITGRCTDAALVCGPAAWWHSWGRDDLDQLAGAVVAGHVLECGAQATGGNYAFFTEVADLTHAGFPLAEVSADGSSVITKHPATGGLVSVGTITAQLLYEIADPAYLGPDVTAHFDTIQLTPAGQDRVAVCGTRGSSPPETVKVATNRLGGFRNSVTFLLCGLDIEAKAELLHCQLAPSYAGISEVHESLQRLDRPDAESEERATALLRVQVRDGDPARVGRAFSAPAIELALASIPGFHVTSPPGDAQPYGVYAPVYLPSDTVVATVVHHDGRHEALGAVHSGTPVRYLPSPPQTSAEDWGPTRHVPLGLVAGARSGDKGGDANIGVWVRDERAYRWLAGFLTVSALKRLLPETAELRVDRYELANLRALNFVIHGLLGEGVSSSTRFDPQGKALGEWLRARHVDIPTIVVNHPIDGGVPD